MYKRVSEINKEIIDNFAPHIYEYYKKHKNYDMNYFVYWNNHQRCEVCGKIASPPHHIKTRKSGGKHTDSNLLSLCTRHHNYVHSMGVRSFANGIGKLFKVKIYEAMGWC